MDTEFNETLTETIDFFGRTYQKYALDNRIYFAPIDEKETSRLEMMHAVLSRVFDDRLIFPPVRPTRVLDCGCGGGDWAVEVARRFPDCQVLGIDVSPHMIPADGPNNLEIQIDDLNRSFTFPSQHFDLVHSQMVAGGIHASRWPSYIQDMVRVLRPGGWCQMVEVYFNAQSDNGTLDQDDALSQWSREYLNTVHQYKDPRAAMHLASWMRNAGLTEVESRVLTLPMCAWSSENRQQQIGAINSENVAQLLHSLALYPLIQLRGMSPAEVHDLIERAKTEAGSRSLKVCWEISLLCFRSLTT
ncbi:S-adenosyl-L-methionine-dependent methyltransferase [Ophiocordyceps camponoti-floridani]|uniref:S-adenosyl-L-methionine-dependent methyltransferase n=1 Tax=Ophiocordyceps camponoti-floridani TaxID=2030778 RepID=A0A8H4QB59_9HYPO|nr:S-adenosyl-L-methionine-dependent methyltransferase [Ophiocordyceps camponoti-floridani]